MYDKHREIHVELTDQPIRDRLGRVQRDLLDALETHGAWWPSTALRNCGWNWDTTAGTQRRFDALVARRLVRIERDPDVEEAFWYVPAKPDDRRKAAGICALVRALVEAWQEHRYFRDIDRGDGDRS